VTPLLIGDWFCGAGGSSVGIKAALDEMAIPHRIYAVNHWDRAIATHSANHADVEHRCVDLNAVDLRSLVPEGRLDVLWASPSCTEHSYAKGGKNIDDQKRASAWAVVHSIDAFRPKIVFIENVKPFVNWGPVKYDARKKIYRPIAKRRGETFRAWIAAIESMGYRVEWRFLNAADFGEAQTRIRFFLVARADGRRIAWPIATHSRDGATELFDAKQPWRAAREIIDRTVPAASIFERARPLAPNTLARIEVGLKRFCSPALAEAFLVVLRRNADVSDLGDPVPTVVAGGTHLGLAEPSLTPFVGLNMTGSAPRSVDDPLPTIMAQGGGGVYVAEPIAEPFHGANRTNNVPRSLDEPIPPLTTSGGVFVVEPTLTPFVLGQHGGSVARDVDQPIPTVTQDGAISIVEPTAQPYLVEVNHSQDGRPARSIEDPLPTVTAKNGVGMVEPFVVSYYGDSGGGPHRPRGLDEPIPTVVTENRFGLVEPFIVPQQGRGAASIHEPLDTVTTTSRGVRYVEPFLTAHFGEREGQEPRVHSIDAPLPTVTHRGAGDYVEPVAEPVEVPAPRERVVEIDGKLYVLDIRFRMLQPFELARAQGFPDDYVFTGTKSEQTAQIGNAVPTRVAKALCASVVADAFGTRRRKADAA
jgi:DNA (cytosine-5)-methyltransferase 1